VVEKQSVLFYSKIIKDRKYDNIMIYYACTIIISIGRLNSKRPAHNKSISINHYLCEVIGSIIDFRSNSENFFLPTLYYILSFESAVAKHYNIV